MAALDVLGHAAEGALAGAAGGPIGAAVGLITGIAPDLLGALFPHLAGSKGAQVAQQVVGAVAAATGQQNPDVAALASLPPDVRAKLQTDLATIALQAEQARLADVASQRASELSDLQARLANVEGARAQTVALATAKSGAVWAAPMLSAVILISFGVVLYSILSKVVPENGPSTVMLGTLATMATQVANYWLGSSLGSDRKTELLYHSAPATKQ